MNRNKGYNKNRYQNKTRNDNSKESDTDNPVILSFREYSKILDEKNDRYERIVKQSRDITIESKRIIFLLHTYDMKNDPVILTDAKARLDKICSNQFLAIAKELHNQDTYQFARAYSPGLQEFIEAYTFYEYIKNNTVSDWNDMQKFLTYEEKAPETNTPEEESQSNIEEMPSIQYTCLIQPIEFMLGVADLSGEVMRRCINSLNSACIDNCFQSSNFLQDLYKGFIGIGQTRNRDMSQKIYTMRQSVLKTEMVCYNIKVRGTEAAKWGGEENKADAVDDDEGFY